MMESGNASTLPCGFHHLKDSARILGTKGLFPRRVCTTHRGQAEMGDVTKLQNKDSSPQGFNIILQDSLSLGWHDWHLGQAKAQL